MAVNLSPVFGAGAQLFDNNGIPLAGGLIYTYDAGTSTPAAVYTSSSGIIQHSNPIVLDASGRVPGGEIWLSDGISYKFVVKDASFVIIGSYDNLVGINSNFVAFTSQEEKQTATQGQTVFTLTTIQYQPGTNNLLVFVNGSKQIFGTNFTETSSTVVTFVDGLNVGDIVDFTTATPIASNAVDSANVSYNEGQSGAVTTTVQSKLQESVSVKDFGAVGDGVTDDTVAIQNAVNSGANVIIYPQGTYLITSAIVLPPFTEHRGLGAILTSSGTIFTHSGVSQYVTIDSIQFEGTGNAIYQTDTTKYASGWIIKNCSFGVTLAESIYLTPILSVIENNQFGAPSGTVGTQNRHLHFVASPAGGTAINANLISNNRFNRAKGSSAIFIQYGSGNTFQFNDFEENNATTTIIIDGGGSTTFKSNWFESNAGNYQLYFQASAAITSSLYYNNIIDFQNNVFNMLVASNTYIAYLDNNSLNLSFTNNFIYTNQVGCYITQTTLGVNRGVVKYLNNFNYSSSFSEAHINGLKTLTAGYDGFNINDSNTGANLFQVIDGGQIDTGTSTSSPYNNTTASAANLVVLSNGILQRSTSSLKYKTDVQDAIHGLAEVLKLRPVTYKGKTDGDKVYGGLIAEEVHSIGLTEFVQYAPDGTPDALNYGNMVSLLVKAIQELQIEVASLKGK